MTDPIRPPDTDDEPWTSPEPARGSRLRYLLRCAWRASHDTTTTDTVTRCLRCGKEWTR